MSRIEHIAEGVTLYLGDCRDIIPALGLFDATITDPPYGQQTGFVSDRPSKWQRRDGQEIEAWDNEPVDYLSRVIAPGRVQVVWGGNYYALPPSRGWLSWFKPDAPPSMASIELAWTNQDRNARQITHSIAATNAERCGHKTQKPIAVMTFTLNQFPDCKTILDPFMGSGTTGVAAVKLGRTFVGIERVERHFDVACRRILEASKQTDLFIEKPKPIKQAALFDGHG